MPVILRSSQTRQSISTKAHNAARAEEDPYNELHSEDTFSSRSSCSENSLSDLSMSVKLSASSSQYPAELAATGIYPATSIHQRPVDFQELRQFLQQDRDDLTVDPTKVASYVKRVLKVLNEQEMVQAILPDLFDILELHESDWLAFQCNTGWIFQFLFSDRLGHPQPDQTLGMQLIWLSQEFPHVLSPDGVLFDHLHPAKDLILPVLTMELKGPKGALSDARLQNQNNGACELKNIVKLKRALKRLRKTYIERIMALSIEITTESVQVTCHWITTRPDGKDRYWSTGVLPPTNMHNLADVQRLVRNALDWAKQELRKLIRDLALLEKRYVGSRKRERSLSEDTEPTMEPPGKRIRKK